MQRLEIMFINLTLSTKLPIFLRPIISPQLRGNHLANSPQARKRARQNVKRRIHNMSIRSALRSAIKKFLKLVAKNDSAMATAAYRDAVSDIDSAVSKGLHHKNRAARLKSRLNNRLRSMTDA